MVARPRPVVGRPLAQNLYRSAYDGKKERRRSLLRASEGFAPVHRTVGTSVERLILWQPRGGGKIPFTSSSPKPSTVICRNTSSTPAVLVDHRSWIMYGLGLTRTGTCSSQQGYASRVWRHIQGHFIAEDYFAQQISSGASECRSYCTGISDFAGTGSRVFECRGDRSHPRSRLYAARHF